MLQISTLSHLGLIRERNEDSLGVVSYIGEHWFKKTTETNQNFIIPENLAALIVADGIGSRLYGNVASKLAVETGMDYFLKQSAKLNEETAEDLMVEGIIEANNQLILNQKKHSETEGMGTTLLLAWIKENKAYVSWVGDSRAYSFNQNNGLTRLTKDHSIVQELVDAKKINELEAFLHPKRNRITQSLGYKNPDLFPGYASYPLQPNDMLLICTDGLHSMLMDNEIESILKQCLEPKECLEKLFVKAMELGGKDNISMVICSYNNN